MQAGSHLGALGEDGFKAEKLKSKMLTQGRNLETKWLPGLGVWGKGKNKAEGSEVMAQVPEPFIGLRSFS